MKLVFATNNAHKLEEARAILQSYIEVCSLSEVGFVSDIEETGETLEENSHLKARVVSDWLRTHRVEGIDGVFADDTGLEIDALDGRPGVYTARWAGEACRSLDNCHKALRELDGETNRRARFRTVVTLIRGEQEQQVSGIVNGRMAEQMSGEGGFGYDPLFIPEGHDHTFAELPSEVKNTISHRARAMAALRRLLMSFLLVLSMVPVFGATWRTHFYYGNVSHIAVAPDKVYGLSAGLLFSVNRFNEHVELYGRQNGLHGNKIHLIHYDEATDNLFIAYEDGKIDILSDSGTRYLSDLYRKDITASKTVNNVTEHNGTYYLSMPFGVLCFDKQHLTFTNTCYIGYQAREVNVEDVRVESDSIYAFAKDTLYVAHLRSNLLDYRVWHAEHRGTRIAPDPNKGKVVTDVVGDTWRAGGSEGIVCQRRTGERNTYLPDGPLTNIPYRLTCSHGRLFMVSGGRWAVLYGRPGHVMIYDGQHWTNIHNSVIRAKAMALDGENVELYDMMNVAVDPEDGSHFFTTSYCSGVYEFRADTCYAHHTHGNSSIVAVLPDIPSRYTWTDAATYDSQGNLRLLNARVNSTMPILLADGQWALNRLMVNGEPVALNTPGEMCIDRRNENVTWIPNSRAQQGVYIHDNHGTIDDDTDDETFYYSSLTDEQGHSYSTISWHIIRQSADNSMWIGTDLGLFIIDDTTNYRQSNACRRIRLTDEAGEYLLAEDEIYAICPDGSGNMWVGTTKHGVYVLDASGTSLLAHYTMDNTPLPDDMIMSLAYDTIHGVMYVGTSEGLLSYCYSDATQLPAQDTQMYEQSYSGEGMGTWTLHPSIGGMKQVVRGADCVYALSGGALFSASMSDGSITQYDKLTGLHGSSITHIAYDNQTHQLVIVYQDGKIDLLSDNGEVVAINDLYLKASSLSVVVNSLRAGYGRAYLAMEWGVVLLNLKKREVEDSYYIGHEAAMISVEDVVVIRRDSLIAVSADTLYCASIGAHTADYRTWTHIPLPTRHSASALAVCDDVLYLLTEAQLYRYTDHTWHLAVPDSLEWIHASEGHLLVYHPTRQLGVVESDKVRYLSYPAKDALFTGASYWCGTDEGLMQYTGTETQRYVANGPYTNQVVNLQMFGTKLFATQGYAWATMAARPGHVMTYDNGQWDVIRASESGYAPRDIMNVAVDPTDPTHFFATTYGTGVWEYHDNAIWQNYNASTSDCSLESILPENPWYYTWTAGAMLDGERNLWVPSATGGKYAVHVFTPQGQWVGLPMRYAGNTITFRIPGQMFQDNQRPNWKWFFEKRQSPQVVLLDDNGTPTYAADDRVIMRTAWIDQFNKPINPSNIYSMTQDHDGVLWMGTNMGVVTLKPEQFLNSNACVRPIIYRNDGTNLVDFLLNGETINAIAVDGGNRKWIGTASSGLYLMSADGSETYAHFTPDNSPLPSFTVQSIAIQPETGEVFVATDAGIASYRSDASEPQPDMHSVYAYPNPVRPDFEGLISIRGLMDNSWVTITDGGGRVVYKTRSQGGMAVWNGCDAQGHRVATGVYSALCNAGDGSGHTVVKILFVH